MLIPPDECVTSKLIHDEKLRELVARQSRLGFEPPAACHLGYLKSADGLTVQISPRIVAVASYSLVVAPSAAVTAAPPGHVWPPPLTVTS